MKCSMKRQLARVLGGNVELNRKVLCIKRSWDEVEEILKGAGKKKEEGKRRKR
ncbi:MAG: hypothetical protein J6B85_14025 [Lachnospiraceae bacterium]|nr:hypothetical protein [Lachnospiraceae bacterium]